MSDFKLKIKKIYPLLMESEDSPIIAQVQVVDEVSGVIVGDATYQWSGSVLSKMSDDEVISFIYKTAFDWAQSIIANANEHVDKNIEFARRYSALSNSTVDIPETTDVKVIEARIAEQVVEKKKSEEEWKLEIAVRDEIEVKEAVLTEIKEEPELVPITDEKVIDIKKR